MELKRPRKKIRIVEPNRYAEALVPPVLKKEPLAELVKRKLFLEGKRQWRPMGV